MKTLLTKFFCWGNSLKWWQTSLWSVAIIISGLLALYSPILAAVVFLEVLFMIGFEVRRHGKAIMTGLLIASLLAASLPRESRAQPAREPQQVAQCNAVVIGGLVIVVGGFIVYKLVKFCKKVFPPPPPPPPPPPTPPPTNNPPASIEGMAGHIQTITINLSESQQINATDITGYGWMDLTQTNNPVVFEDYIHLTMSNSVDMTTWSNLCTIGIWMSSNSVECVIYDGTGKATSTNWAAGNPYATSLTNVLSFKVYDPTKPRQFFKTAQ